MKIVFVKSNTPAGMFIRWFTWSKWNHVGIVLDDGLNVVHATTHGVCVEPLADVTKDAEWYEIAKVDGDESLALEHVGKPYDWGAVFGIRWGAWNSENKWFCSELVAMASGLFRTDGLSRVTPQHLYMISKKG